MGFYLRKSFKFGPIRFNLSKSGVGVSAGVTGFRVGTGPRGNYVHMGRGGIYYRKSLPSNMPQPSGGSPLPSRTQPERPIRHDPLQEIESGPLSGMVDANSSEIVNEIKQSCSKTSFWPFVAGVFAIGLYAAYSRPVPEWAFWTILAVGIVTVLAVGSNDKKRKLVRLNYSFTDEAKKAFDCFVEAFRLMGKSHSVWCIDASGAVKDKKYHAGASNLVSRRETSLTSSAPDFIQTNIPIPTLRTAKTSICFFPDRIFLFRGKTAGIVPYGQLSVVINRTQFVEEGIVPKDAKVVGETWKYVNKKGGPDRRFKDNRKIPVVLYDEIQLNSTSGLNAMFQFSMPGISEPFRAAIDMMKMLSK